MKKFLSLVLALVMTMSLVTISAGATEYKDFTDKSEIKYAEAVTVLNKLGIITGYSEGDFRPEGELTRGAAAKILVSLLIGPDAANALGNETSPYPDVPAGNTFAGVISYCKTAKLINGYGDGTFRPQGTLTGYAFAKMLLGALGYDGAVEGFTGPGWNMKVAKLGGEAKLFDRISFNGNATVTRQEACQLALNTLKGTMVEYSGGMNITNGAQSVVVNPTRDYKVSNQEFATHINNKKAVMSKTEDSYWTVEFGEEHFVDLRMDTERTNADSFGRPSNEWSWKKVTIGTFPVEADYVFDKQVAHVDASNSSKNRATGLGGFKVENSYTLNGSNVVDYTRVWVNGRLMNTSGTAQDGPAEFVNNKVVANGYTLTTADTNAGYTLDNMTIENIADLTDNGTIVEVYVSDDVADFITDVVVIKTQLMEVRRVGSDYVALQKEDNKDVDAMVADARAFNQDPIDVTVENILAEDDLYNVVSGLKAGDFVAVCPVAQEQNSKDSTKWDVGDIYVPETVTGSLSAVNYFGISGQSGTSVKQGAVDVTVGGTKYNVALWARDLYDVDADAVKVTRKDVTLWLDRNGNAMKAKDIGDTSDWFIVGRYYDTLVNNRIVTMVEGWDANGNKMELNLGTSYDKKTTFRPGDLVRYKNSTNSNADWELVDTRVAPVVNSRDIKTSDVYINLGAEGGTTGAIGDLYVHKNIKFIYVTFDEDNGEVESIEIKSGVQEVTKDEQADTYKNGAISGYDAAQAGFDYKKDTTTPDAIKVVVVKSESNDAIASNMMYIRTQIGGAIKDANGNMVYHYTAAKMSADGLQEEVDVYSDDQVDVNTFVAYTAKEHSEYTEFYDLRSHNNFTGRTTSTFQVQLGSVVNENNGLIRIAQDTSTPTMESARPVLGTQKDVRALTEAPVVLEDPRNNSDKHLGGESRTLRIRNAQFLDLRTTAQITASREINSLDDFNWVVKNYLDGTWSGSTFTSSGNNYLETGEKSLVMQLILNDKKDANGFREVALVVITSEVTVEAKNTATDVPDTRSSAKALTLTIGGKNYAGVDGETVPVSVDALTNIAGSYSITGVKTNSVTGTNELLAAWTQALVGINTADTVKSHTLPNVATVTDNSTVAFVVEAENETTATYTFKFTTTPAADDTWTNPKYSGDIKTAVDAKGGMDVANIEKDDVTITTSSISGADILNTGNPTDVVAQLDSLVNWYFGEGNVLTKTGESTRRQYTIKGADGITDTYTFQFSAFPVLVKVQAVYGTGTPELKVYAAGTKVIDTGAPFVNAAAAGKGVLVLDKDNKESARLANNSTATVTAGYTYIGKAFVGLAAGTNDFASSAYVATYKVNNGDEIAQANIGDALVKDGDTITVVVRAAADIALDSVTDKSVTLTGWYGADCSKAAIKDSTSTDTKVVFKQGAGTKFEAPASPADPTKPGDNVTAKFDITVPAFWTADPTTPGTVSLPDITCANT